MGWIITPPLFEAVHPFGLPAMAASDVSIDVQLILDLLPLFCTLLPIFCLNVPSFRFSVIVCLRTICFITYSGL